MLHPNDTEAALHSADAELVARRLVEVACAHTDSRDGAVFLWDQKAKGLAVDFHMVDGVIVTLPGSGAILRPRTDGRPNGIAVACFDRNRAYLCNDTSKDPNYARYFREVQAVLAVPIPWQRRPMGVLTVSSAKKGVFTEAHVAELEAIAAESAKFLRRAQLARATKEAGGRPYFIKGLSPQWREVERRIEQVSSTDAAVLVHGESGTGKDLVSRAIHFNSRRAAKPFVTVNCAAIPENLLESVLFGHVKGAFTGATANKLGEFQKADGGTLFLDELGELPLMLQAKVLRALEQGEVSPVGSNDAPERVDVRLICATNRDLEAMVRERRFRDDLYFRVSVFAIELPPLRTYKENLEVMAHVFLQQAAERHGRPVTALSQDALALLHAHEFPGNVRELKNALEHAVIMAAGNEVRAHDLPPAMRAALGAHRDPDEARTELARAAPAPRHRTLKDLREDWVAPHERRYLVDVLERTKGDISAAAKKAGVNRVTFYRLMKKHGLALRKRAE